MELSFSSHKPKTTTTWTHADLRGSKEAPNSRLTATRRRQILGLPPASRSGTCNCNGRRKRPTNSPIVGRANVAHTADTAQKFSLAAILGLLCCSELLAC